MRSRAIVARRWKLIAVVGMVLAGCSVARADAPPRWKFAPGETLHYVLDRAVDGTMSMAGNEFGIKMRMTFDTTWKCTGVNDDGTANLDQTIDRIQISMSMPLAGDVNYDSISSKKPSGPVWTLLRPMVEGMLGQTFTLKVSPEGKVSDIELPAKLTEVFAEQADGQNRQAGMGIGGAFDEKGIKQLIEQAVAPLPETDDKDQTWMQTFENEVPSLGIEIAETTYSLAGYETVDGKKLTKITAVTEVLFEPAEEPRAEMEIVEQEGSATLYFDAEAGHLVKSEGTQLAVKEISGQQEVTQNLKETFKMYLGTSPAGKEGKQ